MKKIDALEKIAGVKLEEKDGVVYYSGSLDLRGTQITELPDNLTVGGSLYLRGTQITELPDNLTVGGYLDLEGTQITELPDNLTVGGYLDLEGTQITELPDNLTVGGSLDLRGTQITELPDNLTVGGSLYLRGTQITELPDNLTVGGSLDLRGTQITELPDNLTVGGYLDLEGTQITSIANVKREAPSFYEWRNKKYIKADGIFSEVISHRRNVYRVRSIGDTKVGYLITDGNGAWSHGETLQEAKDDLVYKTTKRNKSEYENLSSDTVLTFDEAIACYRTVTGACSFGTKHFVNNILTDRKEVYSIGEIAKETKGQYGNSKFKEFFKIKN